MAKTNKELMKILQERNETIARQNEIIEDKNKEKDQKCHKANYLVKRNLNFATQNRQSPRTRILEDLEKCKDLNDNTKLFVALLLKTK
jgi:hypothetical protein